MRARVLDPSLLPAKILSYNQMTPFNVLVAMKVNGNWSPKQCSPFILDTVAFGSTARNYLSILPASGVLQRTDVAHIRPMLANLITFAEITPHKHWRIVSAAVTANGAPFDLFDK